MKIFFSNGCQSTSKHIQNWCQSSGRKESAREQSAVTSKGEQLRAQSTIAIGVRLSLRSVRARCQSTNFAHQIKKHKPSGLCFSHAIENTAICYGPVMVTLLTPKSTGMETSLPQELPLPDVFQI